MTGQPATYAIEVQGHLDDHWSEWLGSLSLTHNDDGTTTILGPLADQADLHGVLAKLRDLGVPLISFTRIHLRQRSE